MFHCGLAPHAGSCAVVVWRHGRRRAAQPPPSVWGAERRRGRIRPAGPAAWTLRFRASVLGSPLFCHHLILVPFLWQKKYTHLFPHFLKVPAVLYTFYHLFFIRKSIFQRFFYATQYCNSSNRDVAVANISVALSGVSCDNTLCFFSLHVFKLTLSQMVPEDTGTWKDHLFCYYHVKAISFYLLAKIWCCSPLFCMPDAT